MTAKTEIQYAAGVGLVLLGLAVCIQAFPTWGEDFAQLYVAAKLLLQGRNVYDFAEQRAAYDTFVGHATTWGHFYLPSAGFIALPFTVLPYPAARILFFGLCVLTMLWGLWRMLRVLAPRWTPALCVLILGLVMCSACARWNLKAGQYAPIALGLLGLFLVALERSVEREAFSVQDSSLLPLGAFACAAVVLCLKPTFALPFLGLPLLQRRWGMLLGLLALFAALNGIGFARSGGMAAVAGYQRNMAEFERPDEPNVPDPRIAISMPRTDWPYLLNAIRPDFVLSRRIGLLLTLLSALWLLREGKRAGPFCRDIETAGVFLGPLACLSLLAVYHHHYDVCLLVAPLLLILCRDELRGLPGARWFTIPVILYGGLYPAYQAQALSDRLFGPNHVLFTKTLAVTVCTVAFLGSLAMLRGYIAQRTSAD